jgi:phosphatidyl-myo-inositol dimannoside synthase
MIISIITPGASGGYGGISKYNSNLVNFFIKQNKFKKIFLFSRTFINHNNKKISKIYEKNIFVFFIKLFLFQYKIIKSDIIIISHINLILFSIIPILLGRKVILLTYGLEIWGFKKNFFYQWVTKKINFFICMREYTKEILIKKYKLKNKFLFDLHNAIKFRNLKINNKPSKDLVTVARLDSSEKYKGIDETLEALVKFKKINFKYHIIGDGDDKMRLISKAKKLSCFKNITFHGKISDKKRDFLLNNSQIMIMPGSDKTFDTYPFRFIFLEAAEFGLHIIGSYPPNKKEKLYQNYYPSLNFVKPKNKYDLVNLIQKLQKKKKNKDNKLLKNFSIKNFNKSLNNIIIQIISK